VAWFVFVYILVFILRGFFFFFSEGKETGGKGTGEEQTEHTQEWEINDEGERDEQKGERKEKDEEV